MEHYTASFVSNQVCTFKAMCKKLCIWISLSSHKFPKNQHNHLWVEWKVAPGVFIRPWGCNPSGVAFHVLPLLPGPRLGSRGGPWGTNICLSRCRAPQAMLQGDTSRSGRAQMRVSASQRNLLFCFQFVVFFPPPSQALSRGASPPAVVWHCAAIKRWKPGSESGGDRLPGAGRPGPKSIVHLRKLSGVTWQVFKALANFTRKFSAVPTPFPYSAWSQMQNVCHFSN